MANNELLLPFDMRMSGMGMAPYVRCYALSGGIRSWGFGVVFFVKHVHESVELVLRETGEAYVKIPGSVPCKVDLICPERSE